MALHFITHPWEVQDFDDRIVVKYTAPISMKGRRLSSRTS